MQKKTYTKANVIKCFLCTLSSFLVDRELEYAVARTVHRAHLSSGFPFRMINARAHFSTLLPTEDEEEEEEEEEVEREEITKKTLSR